MHNTQTDFLRVFVANLKIDAIYAFYPESSCDKNLAIRKFSFFLTLVSAHTPFTSFALNQINQINQMDWIDEIDSIDWMDQTDQVYQVDPMD